MRENLTYGAMRGRWKREDDEGYLGTKSETMDTDKPNSALYRASALLYQKPWLSMALSVRPESVQVTVSTVKH